MLPHCDLEILIGNLVQHICPFSAEECPIQNAHQMRVPLGCLSIHYKKPLFFPESYFCSNFPLFLQATRLLKNGYSFTIYSTKFTPFWRVFLSPQNSRIFPLSTPV